ncbi:MAG: alpha/beta fold hydrolase [Nitrosomonas sp.]|nr:alpha/beta fold hydrolase [Nitrosomonas sp.]
MRFNRIPVNTVSEKNNNAQTVRYIAFTDWGSPENTQIVICAHGLTRNSRDFDYLAKALQERFRVICVDIVGRGQSDWLTNAEGYHQPAIYLSDIKILLTHILAQYKQSIHLNWVGISMGDSLV